MSLFSQLKTVQGQQWLVVDKVRVPDIEKLAYLYIPNVEVVQLFKGTPFEHLNEIGPVAIKYTAVKEFEALLQTNSDIRTSCVLFSVRDNHEEESLIQHFQALHYVIIDDAPLFFRFYAEPTWEIVESNISDEDVNTILGPFDALSWIDSNLIVKSIKRKENNINKKIKLPYKLTSNFGKELI